MQKQAEKGFNAASFSHAEKSQIEKRLRKEVMEPISRFFESLPPRKIANQASKAKSRKIALVEWGMLLNKAPDFDNFKRHYETYAKSRRMPNELPEKVDDAVRQFFEAKDIGVIETLNGELKVRCFKYSSNHYKLVCNADRLDAAKLFLSHYLPSGKGIGALLAPFKALSESIRKKGAKEEVAQKQAGFEVTSDIEEILKAVREGNARAPAPEPEAAAQPEEAPVAPAAFAENEAPAQETGSADEKLEDLQRSPAEAPKPKKERASLKRFAEPLRAFARKAIEEQRETNAKRKEKSAEDARLRKEDGAKKEREKKEQDDEKRIRAEHAREFRRERRAETWREFAGRIKKDYAKTKEDFTRAGNWMKADAAKTIEDGAKIAKWMRNDYAKTKIDAAGVRNFIRKQKDDYKKGRERRAADNAAAKLERRNAEFTELLQNSERIVLRRIEKEGNPRMRDIARERIGKAAAAAGQFIRNDYTRTREHFSKAKTLVRMPIEFAKRKNAEYSNARITRIIKQEENARITAQGKEARRNAQLEKKAAREKAKKDKKAEKISAKAGKERLETIEREKRERENDAKKAQRKAFPTASVLKYGAFATATIVAGFAFGMGAYYFASRPPARKEPVRIVEPAREQPKAESPKQDAPAIRQEVSSPQPAPEEKKEPPAQVAVQEKKAQPAQVQALVQEKEVASPKTVQEHAAAVEKRIRQIREKKAAEKEAGNEMQETAKGAFFRKAARAPEYAPVYEFIKSRFSEKDGVQADAFENALKDMEAGKTPAEIIRKGENTLKTIPEEYRKGGR